MYEDQPGQPTKRVFLGLPDSFDDPTEEEQDEVFGQMADIFIRELGLDITDKHS